MRGEHRRFRPYRSTRLYSTGPPTTRQQHAAGNLRDQLAADHLHSDPTAGQQVILDLLVFAKARHADATSYLATMPRPWIDRRSHRAWQIVHDLGRLERHIARLMLALVDPALERRPEPVETLADYVARRTPSRPPARPRPSRWRTCPRTRTRPAPCRVTTRCERPPRACVNAAHSHAPASSVARPMSPAVAGNASVASGAGCWPSTAVGWLHCRRSGDRPRPQAYAEFLRAKRF